MPVTSSVLDSGVISTTTIADATPTGLGATTYRELITFGQMTHYGYVAAFDGYKDTVMDDPGIANASGSMDKVFGDQLFSRVGNVSNTPRQVPIFGQAMKVASHLNFTNYAIPSNIDRLVSQTPPLRSTPGQVTRNSMFSDAPDTFQGQYAFASGEGTYYPELGRELGESGDTSSNSKPPRHSVENQGNEVIQETQDDPY